MIKHGDISLKTWRILRQYYRGEPVLDVNGIKKIIVFCLNFKKKEVMIEKICWNNGAIKLFETNK